MGSGRTRDHEDVANAMAEVDAIRRRVVNVVGHALRTPVTTLRGLVEALAEAESPTAREDLGEAAVRNARLVERLLDDLLIATEVTTALPVGEPAELDAHALVDAAWANVGRGRELVVRGGAALRARPISVNRILELVLGNAAQYGADTVTVTFSSAGDRTVIEVRSRRDGGPSDEELSQAFEMFFRGEHAVMRAAGLGIGLPTALALVHHEGGALSLGPDHDHVVAHIELAGP